MTRIPFRANCVVALLVVAAEALNGTDLYFAAAVGLIFFVVGLTYNLLGGLRTFSGIVFATVALRTIIISQLAKIVLHEPSDTLPVPTLSISIYAAFYVALLIGVYATSRFRLTMPKPMEPATLDQQSALYDICTPVGLIATIVLANYQSTYGQIQYTTARNIAYALSPLLDLALVVSIHRTITKSQGNHSLGMSAIIPAIAITVGGLIDGTRTNVIAPALIWAITCLSGGYRFRWKHGIAFAILVAVFQFFISPFQLYTRAYLANGSAAERGGMTAHLFENRPDWKDLRAEMDPSAANPLEEYYKARGTYALSRVSLIRDDSDIFSTCATGYHYGSEAMKTDLLYNIPRFLWKDKPDQNSNKFISAVSGLSPTAEVMTSFSPIGDAFGALGWAGVVFTGWVVFPVFFLICDSVFDIAKPWGTVALGMSAIAVAEMTLGMFMCFIVRLPLTIIALSYLLGLCIPVVTALQRVLRTPIFRGLEP